MRNLKRLLLVITLVGLLCLSAALSVLAIGGAEYTGTMEELNELASELDSANNDSRKWTAVDAVDDYLRATPVNPDSEGYAEAMAKVYAAAVAYANGMLDKCAASGEEATNAAWANAYTEGAKLLSRFPAIDETVEGYTDYLSLYTAERVLEIAEDCLSEVNIEKGTAKNGVALNRVNALVKACPVIISAEGYDAFMTALSEQNKLQADEMARLLDAMDNANSLDEYDLQILIKDYVSKVDKADPSLHGFSQPVSVDDLTAPIIGKNTVSRVTGEDGEDYLQFEFYNAAHTYLRTDLPEYEIGTVIEFDITTFGHLPENGIEIGSSTKQDSNGERHSPGYGGFTAGGRFDAKGKLKETNNGTVMEGAIVAGEWTHISFVFNPDDGMLSYYVNYEYMGKCSATDGLEGHRMHCFRIGSINNVPGCEDASYDGDFALRNFTVYEGDSIRTVDMLSSMTDDDRFIFYCNYLSGYVAGDEGSVDAKSIKAAYDYAAKNVRGYRADSYLDNEDVQSAIAVFDGFEYETFITEYRAAVLGDFLTEAQELLDAEKNPRTLDTIDSRWGALETLDKYLDEDLLGQYVDKESAEYTAAMDAISTFRNQLQMDEKIVSFINSVGRFDKALRFNAAIDALENHYNKATELYTELDKTLIETTGYEKFKSADTSYGSALDRLEEVRRRNNSEIIVNCVSFISGYTEEQWRDEANFDYIDRFVLIVRRTLKEGKYDPDYEGLDEAIAVYTPINDYYYATLQAQHASVIAEQLENYRNSDEYIEMLGICAYVSGYLNDPANDIDRENPEIAELIHLLEVYNKELGARESDYEDVLVLNTRYFVNTVEKMAIASTYAEKKALFDEASLYYFNMNVSDEDAARCIPIYEAAKVELELAREASERFVDSVSLYLIAEDDGEKFDALISCYANAQKADKTIDGVSESLEIFLAAMEEYMAEADLANAEMLAAGMLMASVGGKGGAAPILSAAFKLIFD